MFFVTDVEATSKSAVSGRLLTFGVVAVDSEPGHTPVCAGELYLRVAWPYSWRTPFEFTHADVSSESWWLEQSAQAQREAWSDRSLRRLHPAAAAAVLHDWVVSVEPDEEFRWFVANPVAYDKPWIEKLCFTSGVPIPFHYRSLCLRSMRYGGNPAEGFGAARTNHRPAVPHHALWDARAEAADLVTLQGHDPTDLVHGPVDVVDGGWTTAGVFEHEDLS